LEIDYIAWLLIAGLAIAAGWAIRKQPIQTGIHVVAFGAVCIAISALLALVAGTDLVALFTMSRSSWPGVIGYAASKTMVIGYGALGAAGLHLLQRALKLTGDAE
jgi:hypothetical protein